MATAGDKHIDKMGYVRTYFPFHPRSTKEGYVYEHIIVAEMALGKYLPDHAEIHHVDGNKANNANGNLVVCENKKYHHLLHMRERALRACGNPTWRKCQHCGEYDAPENVFVCECNSSVTHRKCANKYAKKRRLLRLYGDHGERKNQRTVGIV